MLSGVSRKFFGFSKLTSAFGIGAILALVGFSGPVQAELPEWIQEADFEGKVRVRYESLTPDKQPGNQLARDRFRYQVYYGVELNPDPNVKVGVELASNGQSGGGLSSITSQNVTADDAFRDDPLFINKAYVSYTPSFLQNSANLTLTGGKVESPYKTMRFLLDGDVTPEGVYAVVNPDIFGSVDVSAVSGIYILEEIGASMAPPAAGFSAGKDAYLLGNQIRAGFDVGSVGVGVWGSHYHFVRPSLALTGTAAVGAGNNTLAGARYNSEFKLIDVGTDLKTKLGDIPLGLSFQYTKNDGARPDPGANNTTNDEMWSAGIKAGKIKGQGDWEAALLYASIEADAAPAFIMDGDFGSGEGVSNYEGFRGSIKYGVTKSSYLEATYYNVSPILSNRNDPDVGVFQIDYNVKF